jgi:hypothetical protein
LSYIHDSSAKIRNAKPGRDAGAIVWARSGPKQNGILDASDEHRTAIFCVFARNQKADLRLLTCETVARRYNDGACSG